MEDKTIKMTLNSVNKLFGLFMCCILLYLLLVILLLVVNPYISEYISRFFVIDYYYIYYSITCLYMLGISFGIFRLFRLRVGIPLIDLKRVVKLDIIIVSKLLLIGISTYFIGAFTTAIINYYFPLDLYYLMPIGLTIDVFNISNPIFWVFFVFVGPLCDEYIFRGVSLRFLGRFGNRFGIYSTCLLYALLHINYINFIFGFIFSYFLCIITLKYKNILPSYIIHSFVNLFMLVINLFYIDYYYVVISLVLIIYISSIYIIFVDYSKRVVLPYEKDTKDLVKILFKRFSFILVLLVIVIYHTYPYIIELWDLVIPYL